MCGSLEKGQALSVVYIFPSFIGGRIGARIAHDGVAQECHCLAAISTEFGKEETERTAGLVISCALD